jgi:hypothetical protein
LNNRLLKIFQPSMFQTKNALGHQFYYMILKFQKRKVQKQKLILFAVGQFRWTLTIDWYKDNQATGILTKLKLKRPLLSSNFANLDKKEAFKIS